MNLATGFWSILFSTLINTHTHTYIYIYIYKTNTKERERERESDGAREGGREGRGPLMPY